MERDTQEVRQWVDSKLMGYIQEHRHDENMLAEVTRVRDIRAKVRYGRMLDKEDATWLDQYLQDECKFLHDHTYTEGRNYILHIDSLSIYVDAWAQYCRPGTYKLSL